MGWSFGDALANRTGFQETIANYQKFETDLQKGDNAALVEDYKALLASQPSKPTQNQKNFLDGLNTASEAWAKSIDLGSILLTNTGVPGNGGGGPQGDLEGHLLKTDGTPVTLYDYLNNPELVCHSDLPMFDYYSSKNIWTGGYDHIYEGDIKKADGTTIAHIQTGTQDVDFWTQLGAAFGGDFTWDDDRSGGDHNFYAFTAKGTIANFIKDGKISYSDPTGADQTAALKFHNDLLKLAY